MSDVTAGGGQEPFHDERAQRVAGPPAGNALFAAFVARLRQAGIDPDGEQLCDALWLAQHIGPEPRSGAVTEYRLPVDPLPSEEAGTGGRPVAGGGPARDDDAVNGVPLPTDSGDPRIALYPLSPSPFAGDGGGGPDRFPGGGRAMPDIDGAALPLGVPAAPALPSPLELQRVLRPLQRYRPAAPPRPGVLLDEDATADESARAGGLVIPRFRDESAGDTILQLVMDASSSMLVWRRLLTELRDIFGQLGAFRDVWVRYLHEGPDGEAAVSTSFDPAAAVLGSTDRLSDPTGRRITVLVSDCAGPLWHSGSAHRLLHRLASQAPVAVLQPLPQRMWNRTRLPVTYGVLSRGEGLGVPALRLTGDGARQPSPGALAVPVLPPMASALSGWAGLLAGTGASHTDGAVGWVRRDQPPAPAPRPRAPASALQMVSRFRSTASPEAGRLAVYLAGAPLWLPVMQLVQRTMLPDSGPAELAEVLLSGLLTRNKDDTVEGGPWYEFAPGVEDTLLAWLTRDEALLVLKHCSEYVEQHFGKGNRNFPALAVAQLGQGRGEPVPARDEEDEPQAEGDGARPRVPHPFAEVALRVLRQFMPVPARFAAPAQRHAPAEVMRTARQKVRDFDAGGMAQDLVDAVQLLRRATEEDHPGADVPELWAELGRCLVRLWEVHGDSDLLRDAERAAQRAVSASSAAADRAVLARVLHARADDTRQRGDRRQAIELLRRADIEYAAACTAPDLETGESLRLTLERVRALEEQWRLSGESSLLQGAVGMLEAFSDAWPDQRDRPPSLALAHGRTLLRLSEATEDAVQAQLYAAQAARSLRTALTRGGTEHTMSTQARIVLDLVDALLASGDGLDEALTLISQSLETARDDWLRARLRLRTGRLRIAAYESSGDPRELQRAAEAFRLASDGISRDAPRYADVLEEWGSTLLRRAALPDGRRFVDETVRVLRNCRTETVSGSPRQADRLLLLGQALMLRHSREGDRVDLREAEYLFGLAAREAAEPLTAARCWLETGRARYTAHDILTRVTSLEEAAEAFRQAADSAREAEGAPGRSLQREEAIEIQAGAHHWRGKVYEAAARPRAARDAYRAATEQWRKLPDGGGERAEPTTTRLAQLSA